MQISGAMARALGILLAGGWYHVTSRGNRREAIFREDADRRRFLGLVAELAGRFGLEVHAFVLMDNHYHLVVRTPQPNLNQAMQWLNVSYSTRFNWAHRQCGHVFQGRYKAIVIETERGVVEVARYVHLNPVRVGRLKLGKAEQRQARLDSPWDGVVGGLALGGGKDFVQRLLKGQAVDAEEQTSVPPPKRSGDFRRVYPRTRRDLASWSE